jgi:O-antigen/teichoic acid export membrane protein
VTEKGNKEMRRTTFVNFSYGLAGRLLSQAVSFVLMIYLARTLGPADFGALNLAGAIVGYFGILATLGLQVEGVRITAREQLSAEKSVDVIFSLRIVLAVLAYCLLLLYAYFSFYHSNLHFFYLIALYGLGLFSSAFLLDWYYVGNEELKSLTIATVLGSLLSSTLTLWYVNSVADILYIPALSFFGSTIACIYLLFRYLHYHSIKLVFKFDLFKRLLIVSLPFAASTIINQIHDNLDMILLGYFWTAEEVGYYSVAYRIVIVFSGLVAVYSQSTFSAMVRLNETDKTEATAYLTKNLHVMLYAMIPVVTGGTILANSIITAFFGDNYQASVIPFILLLYYLLLMTLSISMANYLLSVKSDKAYLQILVFGVLVNCVANFILIPYWKAIGAAASMVVTELATFLFLLSRIRKHTLTGWLDVKFVAISIAGAIVMGALCHWLQNSFPAHIIFTIIIGIITYFGLTGLYCMNFLKR